MNIFSPTLSLLLILAATLAGTINALGWVNVVILAILVAAWAYVGFMKVPAVTTAT